MAILRVIDGDKFPCCHTRTYIGTKVNKGDYWKIFKCSNHDCNIKEHCGFYEAIDCVIEK